ncbi:MAG: ROK family glucokinase [Clostridiales bacterium]|nr:ROK family glucokinase [Candidatus Equinaster intestinalis]
MYYLGIDLGGTNIATGVVDENYNIIGKSKLKTTRGRTPDEIVDDIALSVEKAIEDAKISKDEIYAVGIGSPGAVDAKSGVVHRATNLGFFDLPLCQMLHERTGFKFYIENDANAAAYGELLAGAGKGRKNLIAITLGTGVGGGIIIDGKIYSGFNGAGGELGHTVIKKGGVQCGCGRRGCWEAYASATALIRQTKMAMRKNKNSLMWELAGGKTSGANGRTAFDAMRKGDAAAAKVVDTYIGYVQTGVLNMINIFQPEVICIGGGISNERDYLLVPLQKKIDEKDFCKDMKNRTELKIAELGNNAGIIGAAFLCKLYK